MEDIQDTVTISNKEYQSLLYSHKKLMMLEMGGVDNWEWYSESLRGLFDDEDEDDEY